MLKHLIDLIFPPSCVICGKSSSRSICDSCQNRIVHLTLPICRICGKPEDKYFSGELCEDCCREKPPFELARSSALYDGVLKEAIHEFKFNGKKGLKVIFGKLLNDYLQRGDIPMGNIDVIMAVPLSKMHERERGYNQAALIAEDVAAAFNIYYDPNSLRKIKNVKPQFKLNREERIENIKGVFVSGRVPGRRILLIDDIYTTGATVSECSRVLKIAGAQKVYILTLARAIM
jgi:ComF family protein